MLPFTNLVPLLVSDKEAADLGKQMHPGSNTQSQSSSDPRYGSNELLNDVNVDPPVSQLYYEFLNPFESK